MKQLYFSQIKSIPKHFGGESLIGRRKGRRPLSPKHPLHLVIKSDSIEKPASFVKHQASIKELVQVTAKRFGIRIHSFSVNFNHLHILMRFDHRDEYVAFIRVLNSKIIRLLETKTGRSLKKLFSLRPFTRIVTWGRDFAHMTKYIQLNKFEAMGIDVWRRYDEEPAALFAPQIA